MNYKLDTKLTVLYKTPKRRGVLQIAWAEGPYGGVKHINQWKRVLDRAAQKPQSNDALYVRGVCGAPNGVAEWPSDSMGQYVRCFDFKSATVADFNQINRPFGILIGLWPMADANLKPCNCMKIAYVMSYFSFGTSDRDHINWE